MMRLLVLRYGGLFSKVFLSFIHVLSQALQALAGSVLDSKSLSESLGARIIVPQHEHGRRIFIMAAERASLNFYFLLYWEQGGGGYHGEHILEYALTTSS